jgi:hypothetical protein
MGYANSTNAQKPIKTDCQGNVQPMLRIMITSMDEENPQITKI